jgi:hypothetical protein
MGEVPALPGYVPLVGRCEPSTGINKIDTPRETTLLIDDAQTVKRALALPLLLLMACSSPPNPLAWHARKRRCRGSHPSR